MGGCAVLLEERAFLRSIYNLKRRRNPSIMPF